MGTSQMCRRGNIHEHFFTRLGHNTQRRHENFVTQLADRIWEDFTMETSVNALSDELMDLGNFRKDDIKNDPHDNDADEDIA